jgi:hypothetical protein
LVESLAAGDDHVRNRITLLEEIRTGRSLGKGGVGPSPLSTEHPATGEEWTRWLETKGLPTAREKFLEWGRTDLPWYQKKKINPLAGTEVGVYHCCG